MQYLQAKPYAPNKRMILEDFGLQDADVLNIYPYGSHVYGTSGPKSDYDFIIVMEDDVRDQDSLESSYHKINATIYSKTSFKRKLSEHSISAMECISLPKTDCIKWTRPFELEFDRLSLRSSISQKSSHSWVKAKKKFEVMQDRDVYIAKKSLFHSMRIVDFGIQIAVSPEHRITNLKSCVDLWSEIRDNPSEEWAYYKAKYQDEYNALMTQFRKVAPKG